MRAAGESWGVGSEMIGAICFGAAFGLPFIVWGLLLVLDRERSWQRRLRAGKAGASAKRTRAWDRRQIIYGISLAVFGLAVVILLAAFNLWAQGLAPAV